MNTTQICAFTQVSSMHVLCQSYAPTARTFSFLISLDSMNAISRTIFMDYWTQFPGLQALTFLNSCNLNLRPKSYDFFNLKHISWTSCMRFLDCKKSSRLEKTQSVGLSLDFRRKNPHKMMADAIRYAWSSHKMMADAARYAWSSHLSKCLACTQYELLHLVLLDLLQTRDFVAKTLNNDKRHSDGNRSTSQDNAFTLSSSKEGRRVMRGWYSCGGHHVSWMLKEPTAPLSHPNMCMCLEIWSKQTL